MARSRFDYWQDDPEEKNMDTQLASEEMDMTQMGDSTNQASKANNQQKTNQPQVESKTIQENAPIQQSEQPSDKDELQNAGYQNNSQLQSQALLQSASTSSYGITSTQQDQKQEFLTDLKQVNLALQTSYQPEKLQQGLTFMGQLLDKRNENEVRILNPQQISPDLVIQPPIDLKKQPLPQVEQPMDQNFQLMSVKQEITEEVDRKKKKKKQPVKQHKKKVVTEEVEEQTQGNSEETQESEENNKDQKEEEELRDKQAQQDTDGQTEEAAQDLIIQDVSKKNKHKTKMVFKKKKKKVEKTPEEEFEEKITESPSHQQLQDWEEMLKVRKEQTSRLEKKLEKLKNQNAEKVKVRQIDLSKKNDNQPQLKKQSLTQSTTKNKQMLVVNSQNLMSQIQKKSFEMDSDDWNIR